MVIIRSSSTIVLMLFGTEVFKKFWTRCDYEFGELVIDFTRVSDQSSFIIKSVSRRDQRVFHQNLHLDEDSQDQHTNKLIDTLISKHTKIIATMNPCSSSAARKTRQIHRVFRRNQLQQRRWNSGGNSSPTEKIGSNENIRYIYVNNLI